MGQFNGPVQLSCVEVQPDGSIALSWTTYADPDGAFISYQVVRTLPGQTSDVVEIITDVNATTYVDNDAVVDGNIESICYQILPNTSNPALNLYSNEICSMVLLADNVITGFADLSWDDPIQTSEDIPAGATYEIYYEYPEGSDIWLLADFFPYIQGLTNYVYESTICDAFVNFRVDLVIPGAPCSSSSSISGVPLVDETAPDIPEMASVSVDSISGNAFIDWFSVDAPDCGGYLLYQCFGNSTVFIDTIYGVGNTEYLYANSNASLGPESFLIASFDTCALNVTPPLPNTSTTEGSCPSDFTSMYLINSWQSCQDYVDIAWTPYTGWGTEGVAYYEVYKTINGGFQEFQAIVPANENTYRDFGIDDFNDYCYIVKAYSATVNSATSFTNLSCLTVTAPPLPTNFGIHTATVIDDKEIAVIVNSTPTVNPFDYVLLRKKDSDPFYQEIDQLVTDVPPIIFSDTDVDASVFSYSYLVGLVNQCNDTVAYSNLGKTIKLEGIANSESLVNTITWSTYENWEGEVAYYEVYRSIDGEPLELIGTSNSNILYYEDDVNQYLDSKGEFCYAIRAVEINNPILNAESWSNVLCLTQPPKIWIPNALAVNGVNDEFKAVISFADLDTYRLIIYSRWGTEIFTSRDIDEGWDGTKDGTLIQEGVYMYYIEVTDGAGQLHESRGPVTLLIYDAN